AWLDGRRLPFVGSGCLLVLEIVGGRRLAPTLGLSLYTWPSMIGVVLAGVSLDDYLGGAWEHRRHVPRGLRPGSRWRTLTSGTSGRDGRSGAVRLRAWRHLRSELRTLRQTFPFVGADGATRDWPPVRGQGETFVLVAAKHAPSQALPVVPAREVDEF